MYHQKSKGTDLNRKGVESFNSLDTNNGRMKIQYLDQRGEYAGADLTGIGRPAVLQFSGQSETELLCVLDLAEENNPEEYVFYIFPEAENRYEIYACQYCGSFGNPCSVVIAPKGTSSHCPCLSCNKMIWDMIQESTFVNPDDCHSSEACFEQILDDIRNNDGYWTWDKYFTKL